MESRGQYEVRFEWGPAGAVLAAAGGPLSPGALFRGTLSPEGEAARACYGATVADATAPG
jgi:hypothetical protein